MIDVLDLCSRSNDATWNAHRDGYWGNRIGIKYITLKTPGGAFTQLRSAWDDESEHESIDEDSRRMAWHSDLYLTGVDTAFGKMGGTLYHA